MHPPFDPQVWQALAALGPEVSRSITPERIGDQRSASAAAAPTMDRLACSALVSTRVVPGTGGDPERELLVLSPRRAADGPRPGIVFFHGGGLIAGSARNSLDHALGWIDEFDAVVVSAEYRLAPEHPYPAALDDCYAAFQWLADNAGDLGIDRERLVLAGFSAGAGLAAAVALLSRERGTLDRLRCLLLMSPMLDDRNVTASSSELLAEGVWDRVSNATAWHAYLGVHAGGPCVPHLAAAARADDLGGLPPTFVDVGSVDTFRDEAVELAQRIWQCGGDAELHVWPGGFHAFDAIAPEATLARAARAARTDWLHRQLSPPPTT